MRVCIYCGKYEDEPGECVEPYRDNHVFMEEAEFEKLARIKVKDLPRHKLK